MKERNLLHRLFSGGTKSELAWKEFLALYSNLFLSIIYKFTQKYDEVMEKYLFVCSKLCKDDFHILKKFNPSPNFRKPKLSTWLTVVVRNLCIDEFRTNHGRRRLPEAIKSLNDFDICVFKLYFWIGYTEMEICQVFSSLKNNNDKVLKSIYKINNLLKETKTGDYKNFEPVLIELDEEKLVSHDNLFTLSELSEQINKSISKLTPIQNMVLKLRFWEGLSPKEIAELLKISRRKVYDILYTTIEKVKIEFSDISKS